MQSSSGCLPHPRSHSVLPAEAPLSQALSPNAIDIQSQSATVIQPFPNHLLGAVLAVRHLAPVAVVIAEGLGRADNGRKILTSKN